MYCKSVPAVSVISVVLGSKYNGDRTYSPSDLLQGVYKRSKYNGDDGYSRDSCLFRIVSQKFIILPISSLIFQSVSNVFVDPETTCSLLKYSDDMLLRHWSYAGMYVLFALQGFSQTLYQYTFCQGEVIHSVIPTKRHAFFYILNKTSKRLFKS